MYLILTIILLGLLLYIGYFLFNKELASPTISFILGFFLCAVFLLNFVSLWDVHIHAKTCLLVAGGCFSFMLGAYIYNRTSKKNPSCSLVNIKFQPISVRRLRIIFLIYIAFAILRVYYLMAYYGMGDLASNLVAHTMALKNYDNETEVLQYPFVIRFSLSILERVSYILAFFIPIYLRYGLKYRKNIIWLILIFILNFFTSLLSSGRLTMLMLLITLGSSYLLTLYHGRKKISVKTIILWGVVGILFLSAFQQLGYLVGREKTDDSASYVVGVYCGAELQNLDEMLEKAHQYDTQYFGEASFHLYYERLAQKYGLIKLKSEANDFVPFNVRRGYSLGNLATALAIYYIDFDFFGTFIICFMIGIFMQYLYCHTRDSRKLFSGIISFKTLVYILLVNTMFMSFFTERVVYTLIGMINLSFLLGYVVLFYLLYGKLPWQRRYNNI